MRRIVVGTALWFATISGAIVGAGVSHAADAPAADDWPVRGTYVRSTMYIDVDVTTYGRAGGIAANALASAGGCTAAATDDSCA